MSKRCAFCEIGFNDDMHEDLQIKFTKSIELFEGIIILFLQKLFNSSSNTLNINNYTLTEAKKESFAVVKAECSRLKAQLGTIIGEKKDKLEKVANQNSDKLGNYIKNLSE